MTCCRPAPHMQAEIEAAQPPLEALSTTAKLKVLQWLIIQGVHGCETVLMPDPLTLNQFINSFTFFT